MDKFLNKCFNQQKKKEKNIPKEYKNKMKERSLFWKIKYKEQD